MKHKRYKISLVITLLLTAVAGAQEVIINQGTTLVNTGSMVLENANLVNNGSFTNTDWANVAFTGSGDRFIKGSGSTQFYALYLNKSANNILLQADIKVAGNLLLTKGSLDFGNQSVQLIYPNGFLQNETEQNRIFSTGNGLIYIEQPLNAPNYVNPGNLGFSIFSSQNLGTTVVSRGHEAQTNASQQQSIKRYYKIVPTNNSNASYNVRYKYLNTELNNIPEAGTSLFQKVSTGAWSKISNDGISNAFNYRESFNLTVLDRFTLFSDIQNSLLPLQLLDFTVQCKDKAIALQWITANEVATKQFTVEASENGTNWLPVQTVMAQGNSTHHSYSTVLRGSEASYFRLKMEDKDSKYTYSPVKKLSCDDRNIITVGPNPTSGPLNISFQFAKREAGTIQLLDSKGSLLQSRPFNAPQGFSEETMIMASYPSGSYLIRIVGSNGLLETKQIIKR